LTSAPFNLARGKAKLLEGVARMIAVLDKHKPSGPQGVAETDKAFRRSYEGRSEAREPTRGLPHEGKWRGRQK
jgi:hypothetical protein